MSSVWQANTGPTSRNHSMNPSKSGSQSNSVDTSTRANSLAAEMEYVPDDEIVKFRMKEGGNPLQVGDQVRVDIPNKDDPDFDRWHGRTGEVVEIMIDDVGDVTDDIRDSTLLRVRADDIGEEMDFRWRDLRPVREYPARRLATSNQGEPAAAWVLDVVR